MRTYDRHAVCAFRFTRAIWGGFSNFYPLECPIHAGPWLFHTAEALYQACKHPHRPDIQARIAHAPSPKAAKAIARAAPLGPGWDARRADAMRWVLRMKREAQPGPIDRWLDATGERPIVEVSVHDAWWGARPVGERYVGRNVLGRLWMELRQHVRESDPAARAPVWAGRLDLGPLSGAQAPVLAGSARWVSSLEGEGV